MFITTDSVDIKRVIKNTVNRILCPRIWLARLYGPTSWKTQSAKTHPKIKTLMYCLMIGIHSEKCTIKWFHQFWQAVSVVHMERQKIQKNWQDAEGQEQSLKTNITQIQDLLYRYSNQESMVFLKE